MAKPSKRKWAVEQRRNREAERKLVQDRKKEDARKIADRLLGIKHVPKPKPLPRIPRRKWHWK